MKLIDREPTPVQVRAGQIGVTTTCAIAIYQAMYDAAPEIQKNPVAWMIDDDGDVEYNGVDRFSCGRTGGVPLYTYPPDAQEEIDKRDERIAELEQDLQTTADALGHTIAQPEEGYPGIAHDFEQAKLTITKLQDLIEEQKGTIAALNWAINGEDSTSTENLIEAHEVDYAEEGLISLCRNLTKENVRLEDVVLFQKKAWEADFEELEKLKDQIASSESSPITEEVEDILRSKNQNLFNALMESTKRADGQAAEIARLKGVIAKCACSLHAITKRANYLDVLDIAREANEALAAIKEIDHATD